jgi:RND family efflux transporter MFP subunit
MRRITTTAIGLIVALGAPLALAATAYDGTVEWSRKADLGLPVSGIVTNVDAEVGESVRKGQVLVQLEATPFEAAMREAQATLTRREVEQHEARRDHEQAKELYARTVLSTVELENAQMKLTRAQAATQAARAALEQAQYQLRHSTLRAPFDGVVLAREIEVGETVVSALQANTLVTLVARGDYLARVRVPRSESASWTDGGVVTVIVGKQRYKGRIRSIVSPASQEATDEVRVLFSTTERLRAGLPVRVELP